MSAWMRACVFFLAALTGQMAFAKLGFYPTKNELLYRYVMRAASSQKTGLANRDGQPGVSINSEVGSDLNNELEVRGTKLNYYGGPIISNVEVVVVFWNQVDADVEKNIGNYYADMTNSTYIDWLGQYNTNITGVNGHAGTQQAFGRGTYKGMVRIKPHHATSYLDDSDIIKEIQTQVAEGNLPAPNENTLYMNYFPRNYTISAFGLTSCQNFCAYHSSAGSPSTAHFFYGVMPDINQCPSGCGYAQDMFSSETAISAHEFMEAITDPFPTPGTKPDYPQAWNDVTGSEIGDLCAGSNDTLSGNGHFWVVQSEWDNAHKKCTNQKWVTP